MTKTLATIAAGAALCALATTDAWAASERDLQVIGRALSFIEGGPEGDITIALVYADDVAGSRAEADATAAAIGAGLAAGDVTIRARVVSVAELGSAGDAAALFVPAGMSAHYGAIQAAGKVTFTTDRGCTEAGGCVVAVQSEPKVEIVVNRAAASAAAVSFESAFRMMIEEI